MNSFKDFNIKAELNFFVGDKIKMDRILNVPIIVLDYQIKDSTVKPGTKCLFLQIEKNAEKHVFFSGSKVLIQQIEEVPKNGFPFKTTIVRVNQSLEFT